MYKIKVISGFSKQRGDLTEEQLITRVQAFMNNTPKKEVVSVQFRNCAFHETWPDVVVTYKEV